MRTKTEEVRLENAGRTCVKDTGGREDGHYEQWRRGHDGRPQAPGHERQKVKL